MTADAQAIRAALLRKSLADSRQRALIGAALRLSDSEMLAIQNLASEGSLTIGDLQQRLQLTSGGTTTLVQRLEQAGHITRRPHPRDRRSALVSITPGTDRALADALAPVTAEVDRATEDLEPGERAVVARFLTRVAEAGERHVDQLGRRGAAPERIAIELVTPGRWA